MMYRCIVASCEMAYFISAFDELLTNFSKDACTDRGAIMAETAHQLAQATRQRAGGATSLKQSTSSSLKGRLCGQFGHLLHRIANVLPLPDQKLLENLNRQLLFIRTRLGALQRRQQSHHYLTGQCTELRWSTLPERRRQHAQCAQGVLFLALTLEHGSEEDEHFGSERTDVATNEAHQRTRAPQRPDSLRGLQRVLSLELHPERQEVLCKHRSSQSSPVPLVLGAVGPTGLQTSLGCARVLAKERCVVKQLRGRVLPQDAVGVNVEKVHQQFDGGLQVVNDIRPKCGRIVQLAEAPDEVHDDTLETILHEIEGLLSVILVTWKLFAEKDEGVLGGLAAHEQVGRNGRQILVEQAGNVDGW
mmetsp:Transcript_6558/g.26704  ORF Transcript_6558/g.26704 Transcript_6558/m.26704 type:complete len:361 (-) Transcript_6558:838-1920(-)